jgi:hypothetical protein
MQALTTGKRSLLRLLKSKLEPQAYKRAQRFLSTDAGVGAILGLIGLLGPMLPRYGGVPMVEGLCDEFLAEGMAKGFNQILATLASTLTPVFAEISNTSKVRVAATPIAEEIPEEEGEAELQARMIL